MTIQDSGKSGSSDGRARRLRLGMVGGGRGAFIGGVHRMAARLDDRWTLVAGALSSDPERAARVRRRPAARPPDRVYDDAAAMAAAEAGREDRIDAVAIVTPNAAHHGPAEAFLEAGFHVICDKPLTTSLATARELADLARAKGVIFAVTHNYTGYPLVREGAVRWCARARSARSASCRWNTRRTGSRRGSRKRARSRPPGAPTRRSPGRQGRWATSARTRSNLAEFVAGARVERVCADLTSFAPGRRLDDNAHMLLRFEGGARGALWCSQVGGRRGERADAARLRGDGRALLGPGEPQRPRPHADRRAAPPRPPQRRGHERRLAAREPHSRRPSGRLSRGLRQPLRGHRRPRSRARLAGREPAPETCDVPSVDDGVRGVAFIEGGRALLAGRRALGAGRLDQTPWAEALLVLAEAALEQGGERRRGRPGPRGRWRRRGWWFPGRRPASGGP